MRPLGSTASSWLRPPSAVPRSSHPRALRDCALPHVPELHGPIGSRINRASGGGCRHATGRDGDLGRRRNGRPQPVH